MKTTILPMAGPLTLTIDGDEVTVTGSVKGNETHRSVLPRPWVWSRRAGGYVLPRSLTPMTRASRVDQFKAACDRAGVPLDIEDTGTVQSEQERRQARAARLEHRAEGHERAAVKAAAESEARWDAFRGIADGIPLGQPILVGHHSERRHRRDIARMDGHLRKSFEANRVAELRAARAENLRRHLERGDSLVTIGNRIKTSEAEIRRLTRSLERHYLAVRLIAQGKAAAADRYGIRPSDPTWVDRQRAERVRLAAAVRLDRAAVKALQESGAVAVYSRDTIAKGDYVRVIGNQWRRVVRVNAKSVSVDTGYSWTDTVEYHKIRGHRSADPVPVQSPEPAEDDTPVDVLF